MWDAETVDRFLAASEGSRFRDLYQLAVLTGMRRSELAGLKWDYVNLVNGRLSVVATLQRILGLGLVEGQPKTARSRRSIALAPEAVELLHGIRGRQIEQRLDYGDLWHNSGFVFTQENGKPINPPSVSKEFKAIVLKAGLPRLTLHGLRHAHATLALIAGVYPKIVSERLGHSSIAVTMDVYSHVLPGMQEEAAQAVEDLLSAARRKRLATD
jgi:integrase